MVFGDFDEPVILGRFGSSDSRQKLGVKAGSINLSVKGSLREIDQAGPRGLSAR
ncbi:hypothetical protein [Tardiphaga sp.]|uniref:hypothetical protein n=1 Tax=Tardiphaga sp. TaxID=1926292 RepID=UPI00352A57C4